MQTIALPIKFHSNRPRAVAYAVPVVVTMFALMLRHFLAPILGESAPLLVFIVPIILSAWYGGFGPGIVATFVAAMVGTYFFVPPRFSLILPTIAEVMHVTLFVCQGVLISMLLQSLHNSRQQVVLSNRNLTQSEERFRLLIESVSDYAIFMLDPDGRIITWNLGAERMTGYLPHEILGQHFSVFYTSADRSHGLSEAHLQVARTDGCLHYEADRGRKDGSFFWADVLITALRNDKSELVSFAIITRDLTERKVAEQDLRESEERYRTVMEAVPQILWVLQPDGSVSFANQRWSEYTGLPRMVNNLGWIEVIHPLDQPRLREYWRAVMQGDHETHVEVRVKRVDGVYRWHFAQLVPMKNAAQQTVSWLGNASDVDDLKGAETKVRQLNATLEQRVVLRTQQLADANAELEHFAYSVAHDLRAPLRGLQGLAQALSEDYAEVVDADGQEYLHHMTTAAEQMDVLIQDLLDYSRLSRVELTMQPVQLAVVLREAHAQLASDFDRRGAKLHLLTELPLVCAHAPTLVQVVSNLLSNAIKFVPESVTPYIEVQADTYNNHVRLSISDNGIGIASEHHQRIWNVFERLHGIESYPGTGIGLAIVRKGVERMGGKVGVESQFGEGSRFWLELPQPENV